MKDSYLTAAPPSRGAALPTQLASVWSALIPAGLALLALVLRWDRLQYAHFSGDQAGAMERAFAFVRNGVIPLAGMPTSVGSAHGPLEIYLLALPMALSSDPLVATAFVGLLQALAVAGTYLFASQYFGRGVGLTASVLFAVNPWAINYARRIWSPDLMPLFSLLFFAALYAAVVERRRYAISLACALLAALFMLHPATVVLWPVLALTVLFFGRRLGARPLLLGAALALLVVAPYLYGDYLQGFPSLSAYAGLPGKASAFDFSALSVAITLATSRFFPTGMGDSFRGEWRLPDPVAQNVAVEWLVYLGLAVCLWRLGLALRRGGVAPRERWEPYLLLLLWFCLPVLASSRNSVGYQPAYFLFLYPVQSLLAGVAIAAGARLPQQALARVGVEARWPIAIGVMSLVAWLALPQAFYFREYLNLTESNGPRGSYGVPLAYSQEAAANLRAALPAGGETALYFGSVPQGQALRYLARPGVEVRRQEPGTGLPLPADPALGAVALLGPENEAALEARAVAADGPEAQRLRALGYDEVPERAVRGPDGHVYFRLFRLPPAGETLPAGFRPVEQPATILPGGMRLLGYALPAAAGPGEEVTLVLLWEMAQGLEDYRGSGREYVTFAHLVDGTGEVAGNAEADIFQDRSWRDGERLATFHEYTLPSGEGSRLLWFDLGAYTRLQREGVAWREAAGGGEVPVLKIGPLMVAPPAGSLGPATETPHRFGEALRLEGFALTPRQPEAGETLAVRLHWRAEARPAADYTVSVQMLDEAGALVTQHDAQPNGGAYPTSYWDEGAAVVDPHPLVLPPDLAPGRYSLTLIVYSADGSRLPLTAPGAATAAERAVLRELEIGAG